MKGRQLGKVERFQPQPNETDYIHLNAGIRRIASCIPPIHTVPHCGGIESLLDRSYVRWGLGFIAKTLYYDKSSLPQCGPIGRSLDRSYAR